MRNYEPNLRTLNGIKDFIEMIKRWYKKSDRPFNLFYILKLTYLCTKNNVCFYHKKHIKKSKIKAHFSANVATQDGNKNWVPAAPLAYEPNIIEKIACFLGLHEVCPQRHDSPCGRHCMKCEKFY